MAITARSDLILCEQSFFYVRRADPGGHTIVYKVIESNLEGTQVAQHQLLGDVHIYTSSSSPLLATIMLLRSTMITINRRFSGLLHLTQFTHRRVSTKTLVDMEKEFFQYKRFAIVGVSPNPRKWGTKVIAHADISISIFRPNSCNIVVL